MDTVTKEIIAKHYLPAPEGEDRNAINADALYRTYQELASGLERERLNKTAWAQSLVMELAQRIANLRALIQEERESNGPR